MDNHNELKGGGVNELSQDVNVITAEINAYQRVAGEAIFEIGRRLKHVKESDLVHGEWERWLEGVGMTQQHANRFMRVFSRFSNQTPGSVLPKSITILNLLVPFDDEELEESHEMPDGSTKKLTEMSRREVEEVRRQLKKSEQQREAERNERERLEVENGELSDRLADIPEPKEAEVRYETKYETKTEYVEVDNTPTDYDEVKQRLEKYTDKFGDLANYDEHVTSTHRQDMIVAVMSMSQGVREFIKRYEYMKQYKSVIDNLDGESKKQYNEAITALKGMAESFEYTNDVVEIIDAEFYNVI